MDTKNPASDELAMRTHGLLQAVSEEVMNGNLASLTVIAVSRDGGVMETSLSCDNAPLTAMHLAFLTRQQHRFTDTFHNVDQQAKIKAAQKAGPSILNAQGKPLNA
jgi:hypothetical protein